MKFPSWFGRTTQPKAPPRTPPAIVEAVVAAVDLAPFTNFAPTLSPADLVTTIHAHFSAATAAIENSGGEVLRYHGDAMLAIWPVPPASNPLGKARIGEGLTQVMEGIQHLHPVPGLTGQPRIGVTFGTIIRARFQISGREVDLELGQTINQAHRMNAACSQFKVPILFPESLPVIWPDRRKPKFLETILVKGEAAPLKLWTLA